MARKEAEDAEDKTEGASREPKTFKEKHQIVRNNEGLSLKREYKDLENLTEDDLEADNWRISYSVYGDYIIKEMDGNTLTIEDDAGDDRDIDFEDDDLVFRYVLKGEADEVEDGEGRSFVVYDHDQEMDQEKFEKIEDCGEARHDYCCGTYETAEFLDDKGRVEEVEIIRFDCGCKAIVMGD